MVTPPLQPKCPGLETSSPFLMAKAQWTALNMVLSSTEGLAPTWVLAGPLAQPLPPAVPQLPVVPAVVVRVSFPPGCPSTLAQPAHCCTGHSGTTKGQIPHPATHQAFET